MWVKDHPVSILKELQILTPKDLKKHGRSVIPVTFFVHGFHREDVLEEHKSVAGEDFSKWNPWMAENRIFIHKQIEI